MVSYNKDRQLFVIKNKYCLECSQTSEYFCEPTKGWLFQQELGYYYIVSKRPVTDIERENKTSSLRSTSSTHTDSFHCPRLTATMRS